MQLTNDFTIRAGWEEAWPVLTDLTRVVPCLPGASLDSVEGQTFVGRMSMRLGPMSLSYGGEGKISPDAAARSIVVEAAGNEQRGGGSAAATITAVLDPLSDDRTRVHVTTDLDLSGRPAQFGRGIMMEVASRLLDRFAADLERELQCTPPAAGQDAVAPAEEPLDLRSVGIAPVLKRVVPVLVGAAVTGLVLRRLARPRR